MADEWFFTSGGQRQGPIPLAALIERRTGGALLAQDLVWTSGMAQWAPASSVPQIGFEQQAEPAPAHVPFAGVSTVAYAQPNREVFTCTQRTVDLFRQTRPWVRFLGILALIFGG